MTDRRHRAYIAAKPNVLELIYNENGCEYHDIESLRSNPNLSEAMIKKIFTPVLRGDISFAYLSANPAATLEFARANQHLQWDWRSMQSNPNVTMDDLAAWLGELSFNEISHNPNLTPKFYWQHGEECNWSYYNIAFNKRFNPEFFVNKTYHYLTLCANITLDFITKNPHLYYHWYYIFRTLKPNQDFVRYAEINNAYHVMENSDKPYTGVYEFAQLTPAFIDEIFERWPRLRLHIDYYSMSFNEHLSLADMEEIEKKHPTRRGNYSNFRTGWDLSRIATRGDIMPEDILKSPLFTAQCSETEIINALSRNPNITVDFVRKNKKYIDQRQLYCNLFLWDKNAYKISLARDIAERQTAVYAAAHDMFGEFARVIKKFIDYQ